MAQHRAMMGIGPASVALMLLVLGTQETAGNLAPASFAELPLFANAAVHAHCQIDG